MYKIDSLINGKIVEGKEFYNVRSPFNNEIIGKVSIPTDEMIEDAIKISLKAFSKYRKSYSFERKEKFQRLINLVEENHEKLSKIITLESGKPIKYSRKEIDRSICTLKLGMEEAGKLNGEYINLDITENSRGKTAIIKRVPIGPILGITPFNFPINLVAHKLSPSLSCGNSFILKPASSTPISSFFLIQYAIEAGFDNGIVQFLPLKGNQMKKLIEDNRIKKISFTGSPKIGWNLKKECGRKKISLELGGNAALIIEDINDINKIVSKIITGGFAFSGQVCISIQRVYINEKFYDEIVKLLKIETEKLKIGDPLEEKTDIGPMINLKEAERVLNWIEDGVNSGGKILIGGQNKENIVYPTILENLSEKTKINSEEVFGPVIILHKYSNFDEAIDRVNESKYGLQAGIYANDISKIMSAFDKLEVGGVISGDIPTFRSDNMPYGGVKESGMGREGVKYAIKDMTELRTLVL